MPGSIPAHTSLLLALPLRSLPRRRAQAVATKSPEMPIFFSRFNSLLAHKVRSPPPSSTAAAPQIIRALPDSPSRGGRDLPFRSDSPGCLANPARRWDGREGDRCAERWPRRRRRNSQSPASWRCATRSSQRGLSGALLAQVPHSSPRDSPPSRLTDRRAANRDAHLSCI